MVFPFSPTNDDLGPIALKIPPIPKKGESIENEEREEREDEVAEGGAERARRTPVGWRRRAGIKGRWEDGIGGGMAATQGVR